MDLIRAHTRLMPVPFVPELRIYAASDVIALWETTESAGAPSQPPPFWAFPWAGGQAVARYVLDHPDLVRDCRVLDVASGSGLIAVAAARAGATSVLANDIDPHAGEAIAANAAANGVTVTPQIADILDDLPDVDVILAGDIFYSREMAARMMACLRRATKSGIIAIVGDPGRAYAPRDQLTTLATYRVPVIRDLEDADDKVVTVGRVV